jgi:hypothetical protein
MVCGRYGARQPRKAPPSAKPTAEKAQQAPPAQQVKHCCGHSEPLHNVTSRPCEPCLRRGRQNRSAKKHTENDRLPDAATFNVQFDAAAQRWTGHLEVTLPGEAAPRRFEATESGVFHLLRSLDRQYREATAEGN